MTIESEDVPQSVGSGGIAMTWLTRFVLFAVLALGSVANAQTTTGTTTGTTSTGFGTDRNERH